MAEYYLVSQLPSLDSIGESTPIPITEQRFLELCARFLDKKAQRKLEALTLVPPLEPETGGSPLIEAWNAGERRLRLALGAARAARMSKPFDLRQEILPAEVLKVAAAAVELQSPLEAERFLLQYRLSFLETLRPMDAFSQDYLFYYGLKLKLILRIRQFDAEVGEAAYRKNRSDFGHSCFAFSSVAGFHTIWTEFSAASHCWHSSRPGPSCADSMSPVNCTASPRCMPSVIS